MERTAREIHNFKAVREAYELQFENMKKQQRNIQQRYW
jgi:hypothetical protein